MIKILSNVCGGELNHKDVARNCAGAVCAIAVITFWGFCCLSLLTKLNSWLLY